jgi:ketosteroid isomerase-like protein
MAPGDSSVEIVRRFYRAVADRDLDAARECFAADAVWILPGRSAIAGEHRGWDAIRDGVLSQVGPLSGETFRVELVDLAVGDRYVVAVQRATAERDGRRLDLTGCQLITVAEGEIAEIRGHYSDQYALDEFWT